MRDLGALHEVLLQAALRAERANEIRNADRRAASLAKRMDQRAKDFCEDSHTEAPQIK